MFDMYKYRMSGSMTVEGILKDVPQISAKWSFGLWLNISWWEIHCLLSHPVHLLLKKIDSL